MNFNTILGIILMIVGLILVYLGITAANVPLEVMAETDVVSYSTQAMYYLIIGGLSLVFAIILLINLKQP